MFLVIRLDVVFQTRNFQGSQKMSRWLKRSKSWRRGFRMSLDSLDQQRSLPRKVSIWHPTCAVYHMLDLVVVCKRWENMSIAFFKCCKWKHDIKDVFFSGWPINIWPMPCQRCIKWMFWEAEKLIKGAGQSFTVIRGSIKSNRTENFALLTKYVKYTCGTFC